MEDGGPREIESAFASPTFEKDGSFEVNKSVGSMSISPCGRDVVLASRQGLHIIDLDSPWKPPRHLPHHTPWEVADVQWSPFAARDYWVVSTSNQRALVWNLGADRTRSAIEHYLHAHTRAITDINFSAHHPDVLATCAVDSFVHCWDLRAPRRPAVSFADWFGGATQVKWNRQDAHVVASSHDRFLRIWDDRKGAKPMCSINAHATKIYGIDWNRTCANALVTCSLDRTIKFWDYETSSTEPERVLHTPYPVWRARHTPFGLGLLAMPQRGDNNLHLYHRGSGSAPYETQIFSGHQDQVKEFLWRFRGGIESGIDNREFQLVTWGADRFLRLHRLDSEMLAEVEYERGKPVDERYNLTRKNATYRTYRDSSKVTGANVPSSIFNDPSSPDALDHGISNLSSSPSFAIGGWVTSGFLNARHGFQAKDELRQDLDPISWMKGVKIGKKGPTLDESTGSLITPHSRAERNWEDFDSLGEEITHVGSKFGKVQFRDVDIQNRYVEISMHGLWGSNETSVFLNCRVDFPNSYPHGGAPTFKIEKTAQVDNASVLRLQAGVKEIGEAYLGFQRSSLEALIRYLQGDQSIEEALAWTKARKSGIIGYGVDEGTSSEEEDDLGDFNDPQAADFDFDAFDARTLSAANASVPLPKGCGAVWAKDGRLVCFFPPKEDLAASLMGSLGPDGSAFASKGKMKYFEGFGKIHHHPQPRVRNSSLGTWDSSDSDSDSSTSSSNFSSKSSSSSQEVTSREHQHGTKHAIRTDLAYFPRLDGLSEDPPASSASLARSGARAPKSLVSIHELESMLPAKKSLAQRYVISGPNACRINGDVALDAGHCELADVWWLLDSIVQPVTPLRRDTLLGRDGQTLERSTVDSPQRCDSGIALSERYETSGAPGAVWDAYGWSHYPLGSQKTIPELFDYFVSLGDVQMLAMMSCVWWMPKPDVQRQHTRAYSQSYESRTGVIHPSEPSVMQEPAAQPHEFGSQLPMEVARSLGPTGPDSGSGDGSPVKLRIDHQSQASSYGAGNSDSSTQIAKSMTPPDVLKSSQRSLDANTSIMSSSPERMRHVQRSSSNLASAFAASLQKPFTFNASISPSPPNPSYLKKRVSPVGSLGAQATVREATRSFERSVDEIPAQAKAGAKGQEKSDASIEIKLKNQGAATADGSDLMALLDPSAEAQYRHYRSAYANLLAVWGLPLAHAEVLQFNASSQIPQRHASVANLDVSHDIAKPGFSITKRSAYLPQPPPNDDRCLAVAIHCHACGVARRPDSPRCRACRARPRLPSCILCAEPVCGLAAPCLACGHVLHPACQTLLRADPEWDGQSCITGCRCNCAQAPPTFDVHAAVADAVLPPAATAATLNGRTSEAASRSSSGPWEARRTQDGSGEVEKRAPQAPAYESLAKNLAGGAGAENLRRVRATSGGTPAGARGRARGRGREW